MRVTRLKELILYITEKIGPVSRLKLAKLVYLIDWSSYRKQGHAITRAYYLRERRGPVPATFGRDLDEMLGFEVDLKRGAVAPGGRRRFSPSFAQNEASLIDEVLGKFGRRSERDLLLVTYLSEPMKTVLREERAGSVRKHEGISFARFPSEVDEVRSADEVDIRSAEAFVHVAPEEMTEDDTRAVMLEFWESLPLKMTADELLRDDREA